MKKTFFILPLLLVLIFSSCSDDSINLAGTTWTSTKDWYGKTRLSFEEGTPYLRPFFAISFGLKSFTIYNVADDNEDLEYIRNVFKLCIIKIGIVKLQFQR